MSQEKPNYIWNIATIGGALSSFLIVASILSWFVLNKSYEIFSTKVETTKVETNLNERMSEMKMDIRGWRIETNDGFKAILRRLDK